MAEHEGATQGKHEEVDQKHRTRQQGSQPAFDQFHAWDQGLLPLTETPFHPRMDEHAAMLSRTPSARQRHGFMMQLHKTYGNRYVQRLMEAMNVQAKLTISDPGDIYEQEADRVADAVTSAVNSPAQRQPEEEELVQTKAFLQRMGLPLIGRLQAELAEGRYKGESGWKSYFVYRQPEEEEELIQGKLSIQRQPEEEEEVQMQPTESQLANMSDSIETRINSARGSGRPLADSIHGPMEQAFGADFSDVRVHTDSEADALNQQLSARAFATGSDVFFKQGTYDPATRNGRKLIAHELTHVAQQSPGRPNESGDGVSVNSAGSAPAQEAGAGEIQSAENDIDRQAVQRMFVQRLFQCPFCGQMNEEDAVECANCGETVSRPRRAEYAEELGPPPIPPLEPEQITELEVEEILLDYLVDYAEENPEGFTVHIDDLESPRDRVEDKVKKFTNYCVAYEETQDCFDRWGLKLVLAHARTKDRFVGGWLKDGEYHFDSVRVYASEYNAIKAAIKEMQDGYFDLDGHYVEVRETRNGPVVPEITEKLQDLERELERIEEYVGPLERK